MRTSRNLLNRLLSCPSVVLRSIYRNNDDDDFLSVPFPAFLDPFPLLPLLSSTQSVNCFLCRRSDDEDGLRAPIVVVVVILLPRAGSPSARARVCPQDIPCSRPLVRPRVPSLPFKPVPSLPFLPISLSAKGETRPRAARPPAITKWRALSECYASATSTGTARF